MLITEYIRKYFIAPPVDICGCTGCENEYPLSQSAASFGIDRAYPRRAAADPSAPARGSAEVNQNASGGLLYAPREPRFGRPVTDKVDAIWEKVEQDRNISSYDIGRVTAARVGPKSAATCGRAAARARREPLLSEGYALNYGASLIPGSWRVGGRPRSARAAAIKTIPL
ncbi:hypothetical protein EVAR_84374_1 [Eumeta japonica]|uniref:Uncharacterized protein n=1 Tax=Eumeta variegata TaxID=151549 RepID=A0A4C1U553_EUMVA|nr:hypothetical protein EVAR_84374_1 [Eumeta japonica]